MNRLDRQDVTWDLVQGPRNYVALVAAQIIGSLLSFGSVWLVTETLGAAGYGGVVALIAAAEIVGLVAVHWTALAVARFGCDEFVRSGRIASTFWARVAIAVPNVLLVFATTPLWLPWLSEILRLPPLGGWLVLSLMLASTCWLHVQHALLGVKLLRLRGWLLALERALVFAVMCALALTGTGSVWRGIVDSSKGGKGRAVPDIAMVNGSTCSRSSPRRSWGPSRSGASSGPPGPWIGRC